MNKNLRQGLRTWIEIDTAAIRHNYSQFRKLISKECKLCGVVKSNAYGHGLVGFSKELVSLGIDWLAVDSITEALKLRIEGIKVPILVLGYTLPEMIVQSAQSDISISISSLESLKFAIKSFKDKKIKIHIKVDSGMHRQGFMESESKKVVDLLLKNKNKIEVEGLFTHFAEAKNPSFLKTTKQQVEIFEKWKETFKSAGLSPIVHASATSGLVIYGDAHFDMVRLGIGMYGLWPSLEVKEFAKRRLDLRPVLSWRTIISEIKKLPPNSSVGYDFSEKLRHPSTIAICPVGYWHGFSRSLSSIGEVIVKGQGAKVVGRVSMDMIVIDISKINGAKIHDVVTIIGKDGRENKSAEEVAQVSGTSHYEFITRLNPLLKKIHI